MNKIKIMFLAFLITHSISIPMSSEQCTASLKYTNLTVSILSIIAGTVGNAVANASYENNPGLRTVSILSLLCGATTLVVASQCQIID